MLGGLTRQEQQDNFVSCIRRYSSRRKEQTIYPGDNFRQLAKLFEGTHNLHMLNGTQHSPADFVVIHSYERGREKQQFEIQDDTNQLDTIPLPLSQPQSANIVFMRGFPSAQWLKTIGVHYCVDPEFFRRHLDFSQSSRGYEVSHLPSSGPRILRLHITDIFVRKVTVSGEELKSMRRDSIRALRSYQTQLGAHGKVGESIIRRISYHDGTHFTIEHNISVYLKRSEKNGWYGM
jgi:hypothetical protein